MSTENVFLISHYFPEIGFFSQIKKAKTVVLLDHLQFARRDLISRTKIKTPQGPQWLTVPVKVKGRYTQKIYQTEIDDMDWGKRHFKTLKHNYGKASFYQETAAFFEPVFFENYATIAELNYSFFVAVCKFLQLEVVVQRSSLLAPPESYQLVNPNHNLPEYPQLWGLFEAQLGIIDLLFNCGTQSKNYL